MKTNKKTIFAGFIILASAVFVLSCDVPLALGNRLDIDGPLVEFTAPAPRKAVGEQFDIEGSVSDNSPIDRLLIKTSRNSEEFPKQWRYLRSAGWQVSEDHGANWTAHPTAQWNGDEKSASWVLPVDLSVNGINPQDGEYMFTVQAWDSGGMSDDNSFKTLVLIYDIDPPIVEVYNPFLYDKYQYDGGVFKGDLLTLAAAPTWKEPSLIGKFLTQEFLLQWQIEDQHDVWSIELLFYEHDVDIDGYVETEVPQDYIYYYHENLPPPELDPSKNIKPNGSVLVPDLGGSPGQYSGGTLEKKLTDKTVIKVVSICFDAAGHVNQEKVLGYFVFWPQAAQPWITFTEGMEEPSVYIDEDEEFFKEKAFMIYPGRNIRATAFQTQGVSKVEFTMHSFAYSTITSSWTIGDPMDLSYMRQREGGENTVYANSQNTRVIKGNPPRPNGSYSTIFSWDFIPESRSANYIVRAQAYDTSGRPCEVYEAAFRVQDITFPDFPSSPNPTASEPLFKFIGRPEAEGRPDNVPAGSIRISGIVADATEIKSLYMVWINPQSRNYAAMYQLEYFRNAEYLGWTQAIAANLDTNLGGNAFIEEGQYDPAHMNKVWKVPVTRLGEDPDTQRIWYEYSLTIDISAHLNIAVGNQPLTSQVFLLRAENPDEKSTIITYAPPGDTVVPTLKIDEVRIRRTVDGAPVTTPYTPGTFNQVPQFAGGEEITVLGLWTEDSTEYLNSQTYFYNNMRFSINGVIIRRNNAGTAWVDGSGNALNGITVNTAADPGDATKGTFTITATVATPTGAGTLKTTNLKDTLVVNASVRDIGGNPAEDGASLLIESDTLRFLRITSLEEDGAYRQGKEIVIFIEFNKPVKLKDGRSQNPVLVLNTTGGANARAYYNPNQLSENTRHLFTYTIGTGQNTPANENLNVSGISIVGWNTPANNTPLGNTNDWQQDNYPFTFEYTAIDGKKEEIRLTMNPSHVTSDASRNGIEQTSMNTADRRVFARLVPVSPNSNLTTNPDYIFTLIGGKRIRVDNTAPTITGFTASPAGWHTTGVDLYITATFSEPVRLGAALPRLTLGYTNNNTTFGQTINSADDVRVNNNQITFRYRVIAGNTTEGNPLRVTAFTGNILDIPGNPLTTLTATTLGTNAATYLYLDTGVPATPTITVHSGTPATTQNQIGTSGTAAVNLGNLYNSDVYIQVTGSTGTQNLGRVEYSLNNGTNYTSSANAAISYHLVNKGSYTVVAKQTDQAGNVSGTSNPVTFYWDPGTLISRISSSAANGTYTHNSAAIPITVYFRNPINVTAASITLNALRGTGNNPITIAYNGTPSLPLNNVSSLTFNYTVQNENPSGSGNGDRMPAGTNVWLNVGSMSITATDANGAIESTHFALPASGSSSSLNGNKEIRVETGTLTNTAAPTFIADNAGGTGYNDQANANYHGIRTDDGSYWTTLEIPFNRAISKGSVTTPLTIVQIAGTSGAAASAYRLPTVLTETQYNRFKSVANFDTYYTKGTNGYINGQGSDTSAKYVLNYQYNPIWTSVDGFTGDSHPTDTFFTDFRNAEGISLSVNSAAVTIDGQTLKVRLSGSNAPQVPGATYAVSIPAGFVIDSLGNSSAIINSNVALRGAARPFVRIKRTQDTIALTTVANGAGDNSTPRYVAAQPFQAYVRMDSRTPNSAIVYNRTEGTYVVTDRNWTTADGPNNNNTTTGGTRTRPTSAAGTSYTNGNQIQIGNTNYGGYQWWVRAQASAGGSTSSEAEEVAYRTAITYRLQGRSGGTGGNAGGTYQEIPTGGGQSNLANGDQIWIRGGDAIGSSSIPGFPFTWEDNWSALANKRAGIRLMTKVTVTTQTTGTNANRLNNSQWQFLTWDMNATAYVDFIRGSDAASTVNQAWQYGPINWAYQRSGWTSFKLKYPINPGEHRWLDTGEDWAAKYSMNFSDTFSVRDNLATSYPAASLNQP